MLRTPTTSRGSSVPISDSFAAGSRSHPRIDGFCDRLIVGGVCHNPASPHPFRENDVDRYPAPQVCVVDRERPGRLLRSVPSDGARAAEFALAGDSTVAPNDGNEGWGDALADLLPPGHTVVNRGANGRSTKSYINEGRWQAVLGLEPDYVLIQFGPQRPEGRSPNRGHARGR